MKTFKKGDWGNTSCPICKKTEENEEDGVVLVPIYGTIEGNISKAVQVHLKCIVERALYMPGGIGESDIRIIVIPE